MPTPITYHGVEAYRQDGLSISPHYEVVDQTAEGLDIFQCRMVIENRARTCLLVEVWENDPVAYRVLLTGQAEVEAHRARYFA